MDFRRWRYFYLCLVMLFGVVQLWADVTGSLVGYVRDSSGAVIPKATLTVTQTATGYTRTATTDSSGAYSILALPPGSYRLTASVAGFENGVVDNINLNVNDALKFDFALKVGNVS
jgi:Carboxypeptidase regulatory-like domain